jgi:hypothetical protein
MMLYSPGQSRIGDNFLRRGMIFASCGHAFSQDILLAANHHKLFFKLTSLSIILRIILITKHTTMG